MDETKGFQEELDRINADLNGSLTRLVALLEKARADMDGPRVRHDEEQREQLTVVVRGLEEKIAEIRAIGLPRP